MISKIFQNTGQLREYQAQQIIIFQRAQLVESFYIKSGYVVAYDINPRGEKKVLVILGKGDIFPIIWSFKDSYKSRYFYETYTAAEIYAMPLAKLVEQTKQELSVSNYLLEKSTTTISELMLRLETIESTSSAHKVGEVFMYLCRTHGKKINGWHKILPPITHQTIADMSALSRETVSIQSKALIDAGAIKYEKQHYHVDLKILKGLLGAEEIS